MGAVGASLTTDLVDLISARVWLCVAQVQRALVQALAARPATTTGCSGGVVVLLLELRGAGACSAEQCPPLLDLWCGLVENTTTRHALRPGRASTASQ